MYMQTFQNLEGKTTTKPPNPKYFLFPSSIPDIGHSTYICVSGMNITISMMRCVKCGAQKCHLGGGWAWWYGLVGKGTCHQVSISRTHMMEGEPWVVFCMCTVMRVHAHTRTRAHTHTKQRCNLKEKSYFQQLDWLISELLKLQIGCVFCLLGVGLEYCMPKSQRALQ